MGENLNLSTGKSKFDFNRTGEIKLIVKQVKINNIDVLNTAICREIIKVNSLLRVITKPARVIELSNLKAELKRQQLELLNIGA